MRYHEYARSADRLGRSSASSEQLGDMVIDEILLRRGSLAWGAGNTRRHPVSQQSAQ